MYIRAYMSPCLTEISLPPLQDRQNAQSSCAGLFIAAHLGFDYPGIWMHVDMATPVHCVSDSIRLLYPFYNYFPAYLIWFRFCFRGSVPLDTALPCCWPSSAGTLTPSCFNPSPPQTRSRPRSAGAAINSACLLLCHVPDWINISIIFFAQLQSGIRSQFV